MARIVMVHGVGQQLSGPNSWRTTALPALRDGVHLADGPAIADADVACGFYGDLFRRPGARSIAIPPLDANDVRQGLETDLLLEWWKEASRTDSGILSPEVATRGNVGYVASRPLTTRTVQRALNAISRAPFFAGMSEQLLIFCLKQVRRYFEDEDLRSRIRARVAEHIDEATRVVIGHSLGSVVAYEVLCAQAGRRVAAFVTVGSPLGLRQIVFDRLCPAPCAGVGAWPGAGAWINVADTGDIVALTRELNGLFDGPVCDRTVSNGVRMHDAAAYLTAKETGAAVAAGLTGEGSCR